MILTGYSFFTEGIFERGFARKCLRLHQLRIQCCKRVTIAAENVGFMDFTYTKLENKSLLALFYLDVFKQSTPESKVAVNKMCMHLANLLNLKE